MTPTQGEHAQTEALAHAAGLESFSESLPAYGFNPQPLKDAAETIRRLHAQVAALTAAPEQLLSPTEQKWVLQSPAAIAQLLTFIDLDHSQAVSVLGAEEWGSWPPKRYTELKEIGRKVIEQDPECFGADILREFGFAAPAQPAAPQGVAYAELPDWELRALAGNTAFGYAQKTYAAPSYLPRTPGEAAVFEPHGWVLEAMQNAIKLAALRASNGQAPAGATANANPDKSAFFAWWAPYQLPDYWMARIDLVAWHAWQAATAQAAPAAGEAPAFTTGDAGLDALLNETANMQRGPEHNNMDTALLWQECLETVLARLSKAPAAGAVAVRQALKHAIETMTVESQMRDDLAENRRLKRSIKVLEQLAAAPTPAAQADSQPSSFGSHELQAMILARCVEKDKADSVLEDAALLEQIAEAIRDYHHALDMRKNGGLAESVAFNSICQTMGMNWNQGEEAARRAARKQGGTHD
jgi:hypothetical protein